MTYQVLCAYDGSPSAEKAFDFAVELAKNFEGELHVLAVVQPPEPAEDIETEALFESGQERFTKDFEPLRDRASQAGVAAEFEVAVSHPAEQILYHADHWKATTSCSDTAARTPSSTGSGVGIAAGPHVCIIRGEVVC